MNLNTLFEGAVDELEKRRIQDLEMKMDDLSARAKESKDPKVIAALRHEFAKHKAERDSYHYVKEDEVEEAAVNPQFINAQVTKILAGEVRRMTNAPMAQLLAPVMKEYNLTLQQIDSMVPGGLKKAAGEYGIMMKEGWQDFNKVEPYEVCLAGKPVKTFDYYEEARRFHDNWKQKLYREGNKEKADKITLNPIMKEDSMAAAEKHPEGPEFTGYWKGTDSATPGNKMVGSMEESAELDEMGHRDPGGFVNWARKQGQRFDGFLHDPAVWAAAQDAYSQEFAEGAKVDRMVKHITKSEKDLGKSKKDAEAIAWATANKRGMLDNANKKDDVEEGIGGNMCVKSTPMNLRTPKVPQISKAGKGPHNNAIKKAQAKRVAENFVQWAVNEGYTNFTSNPAMYEQAKQAYKLNENLTKLSTEQLQAIWNSHKDEQRPSPALAMKLKAVVRELQRRKGMNEDLGSIVTGATELWNVIGLIKEYGLPLGLFAAAVGMYGLAKAAEYLEQGEDTFAQIAKPAVKKVPPETIHKITDKLNQAFAKVTSDMKNHDPMHNAQSFAEEDTINEIKKGQKDSNGNTGCWDGYHAAGTKKGKNGGQVRNCVPNESVSEDWQKANKKDKTDGMSQKAVNAYKRENPGSKLKTAVTKKPSQLKAGSKDAKRRKSFCARMSGNKGPMKDEHGKPTPKAKALSRWNCESIENLDAMLAEAVEKGSELQPGQYYVWTVYFDDGSKKQIKVTKDTFDPKAYYAKKNQNVIKVDYSWEPHNG